MNEANPTGCGFTDEVGSSDLITDNLISISSSDVVVLSDTEAEAGTVHVLARVDFTAGADGDVARLFVKWTNSTTYWAAQLTVGASGHLRIFEGATQRATASIATSASTSYQMTIYYCDGEVTAYLTEAAAVGVLLASCQYTTTTSSTAVAAGVGTGSISGGVDFSNFLYEYRVTGPDGDCDPCNVSLCDCDEFTIHAGASGITPTTFPCGDWLGATGPYTLISGDEFGCYYTTASIQCSGIFKQQVWMDDNGDGSVTITLRLVTGNAFNCTIPSEAIFSGLFPKQAVCDNTLQTFDLPFVSGSGCDFTNAVGHVYFNLV